ncbi:MAG: DDE-type integrase/transposase/recombinase, partial [Bacteroidota bacterium]
AMRHFYPYLGDRRFLLVTDHRALQWLSTMRETMNQRIQTWIATLSSFDYTIQHRPGRLLAPADMLSRLVAPVLGESTPLEGKVLAVPNSWIGSVREQEGYKRGTIGVKTSRQAEDEEVYELRVGEDTYLYPRELLESLTEWDEGLHSQIDGTDLEGSYANTAGKEEEEEEEDNLVQGNEIETLTGPRSGGLAAEQLKEVFARAMMEYLEDGKENDIEEIKHRVRKEGKHYSARGGFLEYKGKPYVPYHLRRRILHDLHDSSAAGHPGLRGTYERVSERFAWPGMFTEVKRYVETCEHCQRRKGGVRRGIPAPPQTATVPYFSAQMDCMGPFPATGEGFLRVFTVVDVCTRYLIAVPVRSETSEELAEALFRHVICVHGCPLRLGSDRGPGFVSSIIRELCKLFEIHKVYSSGYRPQTNAVVERKHRVLEEGLSHYLSSNLKDWDRFLPVLTFAINTSRHRITHFSSYELMHGHQPLLPTDVALATRMTETRVEFLKRMGERVRIARVIAADLVDLEYARERDKKFEEEEKQQFELGASVYAYLPKQRHEGMSTGSKLRSKWFGPYTVSEVLDSRTYRLRSSDPVLRKKLRSRRSGSINADYLKAAEIRADLEDRRVGEALEGEELEEQEEEKMEDE